MGREIEPDRIDDASAPIVAIGGLGGSGTRVFASLIQHAGIFIGSRLNDALDNLWFTVLFKRACWAAHSTPQTPDPREVSTSIRLFQRAMTTGLSGEISPADQLLLEELRANLPPDGNWFCGARSSDVDDLLASSERPQQPWGWKEPNTHLFLPLLNVRMPTLHYIHIVRNGIDMAISKNTWQARHWSHLYGLTLESEIPLPLHQLRYWSRANRVAIDYGVRNMPGRFLVIDYEDFCLRPAPHWRRILNFIGVPDDRRFPDDLIRPTSIGRADNENFNGFPVTDLDEAAALQTDVAQIGRP